LLYGGAGALVAGTVAAVAWSFMPLDAGASADRTVALTPVVAPTSRQPASGPINAATLAALDSTLSRPLRGKVAAAAAPAAVAQPQPPPPSATPGITLVGTIGDGTAMFRVGDGNVIVRSVGQRVGDAEVVAIRAGEAQLRTGGGIVTIRKNPTTTAVTP
jgi:hypothetical protein